MAFSNDTFLPVRLLPARAWRTYRGGALLSECFGETNAKDSHFPEAWLLSTVTARNPGREHSLEGLSLLADTQNTLADFLSQAPEKLLGKGRTDLDLLVKLIDSAERLSVQVHPTRQDAKRFFNSEFGKTECWHILGGREINGEKPYIYLGFRGGVTQKEWRELFFAQDIPGMLECLHRIEVQKGETYLIPGGTPHAIGAGCFLAEIQEPTDLTLRVERTSPSGEMLPEELCHQGVGFEKMLDCFNYSGCCIEETKRQYKIPPCVLEKTENVNRICLLSYETTPYFYLEKIQIQGALELGKEAEYSGFYVLDGEGELICEDKREMLSPGRSFFVPAQTSPYRIARTCGMLTILRYKGPKL